MSVNISTTTLWLFKDIFWASRVVPLALAFGGLAVVSQGHNIYTADRAARAGPR
jgi:hypothetical protein